MAETDILLTVGLDTTDADKTAGELQKEVEKIFNARGGKQSAALTSLEKQMKQTYLKATELREKLLSIGDVDVPSEEYQKLEKDLNSLESAASKLSHKMREFEEKGGDTTSDKYQRWERQIEQIGNKVSETVDKMEQMKKAGTDTISGTETDKYKQTQEELDGVNDKLKQQIIRYREIETKGAQSFSKVNAGINLLKKGLASIAGLAKKAFSAITRGAKSTNKPLGMSLKTILGYALGIRSLYALFSKIRAVVKEAFTNLYKDNDKFKKSVDELKGALTTLKNSFASAFQPIVSMAIPYIQSFIEWVTKLMDQIARFAAAAVGQKYYMRAIKQTGNAAEKASRQLSKLDNLNVLSSDGSGGKMFEEVAIDEEQIDLLAKLREVVAEMEGVGNKFGTAIKNALNSIPWDTIQTVTNLIAEGIGNFINGLVRVDGLGTSIGNTFGELLNTIMQFKQTLLDTIDFEAVGKFFGDIAQGFVDTFDWVGQGELWATEINSLAEAVKGFSDAFNGFTLGSSASNTINSFMESLNWDTIKDSLSGLADDLSGTINGFVSGINWAEVADTLIQGISSLLGFVTDFIANLDMEEVGESIVEFLDNIDWLSIAAQLGLLLLTLVEKAVELLFGMVSGLSDSIANWFESIGADGVAGFFRGISENLRTSVQALKDFFNNYIVQPIKDFFGIHSPSTLFADFGGMLIQGLIDGITSKFAALGELLRQLKEHFLTKFTEIKAGVVNVVEGLWEAIKTPINSIIGGFEFLVNCVINALNKMINACNSLQFDIPDWIPSIGGESFGLNIPTLNEVSIPRLAQGAVIPPNKEFMAMLGDQKSGTNIEAPLDTIKQAMLEVLTQTGNKEQEIVINLDGREILKAMVKQNAEYKRQHNGASAFG